MNGRHHLFRDGQVAEEERQRRDDGEGRRVDEDLQGADVPLFTRDGVHAQRPRHGVESDVVDDGVQDELVVAGEEHLHDGDAHEADVAQIGRGDGGAGGGLVFIAREGEAGEEVDEQLQAHRKEDHPAKAGQHFGAELLAQKRRHHQKGLRDIQKQRGEDGSSLIGEQLCPAQEKAGHRQDDDDQHIDKGR